MVPEVSGYKRSDLIPPSAMVPPMVWLASDAGAGVTGRRYIAAEWKADRTVEARPRRCRGACGLAEPCGCAGVARWQTEGLKFDATLRSGWD